ncbi:MAG TPA: DUF5829 family protein [Blastocatellia bacterium]|jgi:hypothetical protein
MKTIALIAVMTCLIISSPAGQVGSEQRKMTSQAIVSLNHFFVVLDSATYRAMEQDDFLRNQFAVTEKRTTVRTDTTYTGLYFYGTNTYFEFFDASGGAMRNFGAAGLAFGVDRNGLVDELKADPGSPFRVNPAPITRGLNDRQVPWFYMIVPRDFPISSGLSLWVMEYHPRFLAEWNSEPDDSPGVSRKDILGRYKKVLGRAEAKTYFEDVVAMTIALDEAAAKRLFELCQSLGFNARTEPGATLLEGPDLRLKIVPRSVDAQGIREVTMRVGGRPPGRGEFRFGPKVGLRFHGDNLATWSF